MKLLRKEIVFKDISYSPTELIFWMVVAAITPTIANKIGQKLGNKIADRRERAS